MALRWDVGWWAVGDGDSMHVLVDANATEWRGLCGARVPSEQLPTGAVPPARTACKKCLVEAAHRGYRLEV